MTDYRRIHMPNATWFFTVNLAERQNNHLLVERIDSLRTAFRYVKERRPFQINAVVIMPDHLHCIWTLPPGDVDFSIRWNLLKDHFDTLADSDRANIQINELKILDPTLGLIPTQWQQSEWAITNASKILSLPTH